MVTEILPSRSEGSCPFPYKSLLQFSQPILSQNKVLQFAVMKKMKNTYSQRQKKHHDSLTILCPYPYSFFIFPIDKNKVKNVLEDVTLSKIYFRQGICKIMSAEKIHSIQKNMRSTAMDPSQKNEVTNFL